MDAVITVEHLQKRYGTTVAVDDVSFDVGEGEIFGLLGPNGAGKTTTVECIQGLRRPDGGTIRVLGFDPVTQGPELRRHIGSQLQESALPDRLRVGEAVKLFASFSDRAVDPVALVDQWGLADRRDAAFGDLSGGQRQRLFIALAFVNNPQVVFLDELTAGLDPQARHVAWELVRQIRDGGTTVVLVTHFMEEAEYLCDRVAIVDRGRIAAMDRPQALIDSLTAEVTLRFSAAEADVSWLNEIDQVSSIERRGPEVQVSGTGPVLPLVASALLAHGILPTDMRVERPTLEDAFLALTGRDLRSQS